MIASVSGVFTSFKYGSVLSRANKNANKMATKILLPNGCYRSPLAVFPKNWKQQSASVKMNWYITYRFYDPSKPKPAQFMVKGMNDFKTIPDRREATAQILELLEAQLAEGYNPITAKGLTENPSGPESPLCLALNHALKLAALEPATRMDMKSVLKYVEAAAKELLLDQTPVSEIRRKHLRMILDQCGRMKPRWSDNLFNHYRKYLGILFGQLVEIEAVESNPVRDLAKRKITARVRQTLTDQERKIVDEYLKENYPDFWRFTHIFFHSGARISELLALQVCDVNLEAQKFKVTIKKGRSRREVWKPIKDIAVGFWRLSNRPTDYVFSEGLKPGPKMITPKQITNRWRKRVKEKIGIEADFYSLKHSNLDETSSILSINDASKMAGHTTPVITLTYATGERERQNERLRKVNNPFA